MENCGGRGHNRNTPRQARNDSQMITLRDGTQIEYHASFNCPRHVYLKMKQEDKYTLKRERALYNQNCRQNTRGNEIEEQQSQVQALQQGSLAPMDNVSVSQRSQVSQVTASNSIMGGRNEQAQNHQAPRAGAVVTIRRIQSATPIVSTWKDPIENTAADNECDTKAETCCLGENLIVFNTTYRTSDVYAYATSIKPVENIPIVSGATAYDDPVSGDTFILVFHECLYHRDKLDHTLTNPNQLCSFGIPFWDNPFDADHPVEIDVNPDFFITLKSFGT
jgi:hypothetical protein